ncbi:tripartite tricarboxylate transporter substrate binding protein [Vallitalea okinawensis]|uniref:tripartite tricarboxylate transporter substrate binding protein n=1 Tax=Vallitalea okinawensis TaxID=2078660 RepID=UPI000CFDAA31|nr:tripartite tricarboxylate transporter substrate binding protein [Vallitalea okinawensis]
MKKICIGIMVILLLSSLVGCSNNEEITSDKNSNEGSSSEKIVEEYLSEPLRIIVPYAAGGGADIANRLIAKYLSDELGTDVIVENKPGAGGVVASTEYLTEKANTNTIIYTNSSLMSYIPMAQKTAFTRKDFDPIFSFQIIQFGLYAAPENTGIKSIEDLEAFAKENRIVFGSPGVGKPLHSTQKKIYTAMGAESETVTAENGNQGIVNLLANDTNVYATSLSTADQFVKEGSIVPLAILSNEDYDGPYGKMNSISDYGYEVSNDMLTMFAIRSGTDEAIINRLYEGLLNVCRNEEFIKEMEKAQNLEMKNMDAEQIKAFLDDMDKISEELLSE